uniref:Large ribosomal subunit protein uL4c n=1 Tax=Licmophora sp. TaxID=2115823 RepID=A0A2U9NPE0_9STRA|nr:ribosomal protein L4 [Licmophora sp.]
MSIQKLVTYRPVNFTGEILNLTHELNLTILENSGNYLIHKDILRHHVLQQQGTVSTKTRSEVRGGGKKPWRQKGTGRARAGSSRSPLWKGGGVSFGPKPRIKTYKLNKKERKLALQTLLYNKKDDILIIDQLESKFNTPKTNEFYKICKNCGINLNQKVLLIVSKKIDPLKLAVQNIKNVELILSSNLNTLSLIKSKQVILTLSAIEDIKETFNE